MLRGWLGDRTAGSDGFAETVDADIAHSRAVTTRTLYVRNGAWQAVPRERAGVSRGRAGRISPPDARCKQWPASSTSRVNGAGCRGSLPSRSSTVLPPRRGGRSSGAIGSHTIPAGAIGPPRSGRPGILARSARTCTWPVGRLRPRALSWTPGSTVLRTAGTCFGPTGGSRDSRSSRFESSAARDVSSSGSMSWGIRAPTANETAMTRTHGGRSR